MIDTLPPNPNSRAESPVQRPSFGVKLQQYFYDGKPSPSPDRRLTRAALNLKSSTQSSDIGQSTRSGASMPEISSLPSPVPTSLKRKASEPMPISISPPPTKKNKRPSSGYAPPSKYAYLTNLLTDSLAPHLICVFIGVNPGIRTATTGHAYSHPSNLFYRLCHSSGCTPRLCKPEEDQDLPHLYALGHTNIVSRPTKDASELSAREMDEGVMVLEEKIRKWRPESVCIVGKGIWECIWRVRHGRKIRKEEFRYGWQEDAENMAMGKEEGCESGWMGARVFVATTTSGLAAGMRPWEKEEVWRGLGEWVEKRRRERGGLDEREVKKEVKEDVVEGSEVGRSES